MHVKIIKLLREGDRREGEKQRTERLIWASNIQHEKWISSWRQIEVSYDKCPPLYPQWEYCPALSYQLPVPCSVPTDTRWPSWSSQSVAGSYRPLTETGVCFQLPAPTGTVITVYSFILMSQKTLKGKEEPSGWTCMKNSFSNPYLGS